MNEPKPTSVVQSTQGNATPERPTAESAQARGSGQIITEIPRERPRVIDPSGPASVPERSEHSVMEGLPQWKADRVAAMRRELAELQRQLIESQQRIATELQGRADDAERYEALETRLQAQEAESQQRVSRAAEVETELATLRKDIATRDTLIEEARQRHREMTEQLDGQRALLQTRDAELATRTTEVAEQRKQQQAATGQLEVQTKALADANALVQTRDTELATMKAERDASKAESEQARRDLEGARAKARDIANQLVRFGQDLTDGGVRTDGEPKPVTAIEPSSSGLVPPLPKRAQPPALPQRRAEVETIVDVTADAKPAGSRVGSMLLVVGGVALGCVVTLAIMNASSSRSTAAAAEPAASASAVPAEAVVEPPPAAAINVEGTAESAAAEPTPVVPETGAIETPSPTAPVEATTGTIVLPREAANHRVFVDGRVVEVNSSRAVVSCGTREIKIGSRGTAQTIDVACGGTTELLKK
jgi:hypothetical protein